jgi:5S rRNA maturation endonuclease (ribonuclease M5)
VVKSPPGNESRPGQGGNRDITKAASISDGVAYDRLIDVLADRVVRSDQVKASARCPAHDDTNPSLSITAIEGQVLVYCHAGCETVDVMAALDMTMADLYDTRRGADYHYDNGRVIHRKLDKTFPQTNTDRPPELYRLAKVKAAVAAGRTVYVVEGEKDVHALETLHVTATTNPMGAGKWSKIDPSPLYGAAKVVIIADRDKKGARHASDVLISLKDHVKQIEVMQSRWGKDAADLVAAGLDLADLEPVDIDDDLPPLIRLDHFLATLDEPLAYRVDQLWPTGGRVILAAAWKAGKTTLLGNLIRALVDDQPFLGRYTVQPARRVVLIDDELDKRTLRRWLREQGIVNTKRVELIPLRGKVSAFNILNPEIRAKWARHLRPGDVLLFDCLRPVLDALGLKESTEVGQFLVAFDALLAEAVIPEGGIAHHMGHVGERSRGDSRLRDWPDVEWRLVRDKSNDDDGETDPAAARYFAAYGRDVDQPEQLLSYDPATRRLTITGGSRKDTKAEALIDAVVQYVAEDPGCSQNAIEKAVQGRREDVRKARDRAVDRRLIVKEKVGNKWIHTPSSPTRPNSPGRTGEPPVVTSPPRLYEGEVEVTTDGQPTKVNSRGEGEDPDWIDEVAAYLGGDGAA